MIMIMMIMMMITNAQVYLGRDEGIGCFRNDKLCGRIVLEPDDIHLQGNDDDDGENDDI